MVGDGGGGGGGVGGVCSLKNRVGVHCCAHEILSLFRSNKAS